MAHNEGSYSPAQRLPIYEAVTVHNIYYNLRRLLRAVLLLQYVVCSVSTARLKYPSPLLRELQVKHLTNCFGPRAGNLDKFKETSQVFKRNMRLELKFANAPSVHDFFHTGSARRS
eukprot:1878217-Amphidinium_carterae.1